MGVAQVLTCRPDPSDYKQAPGCVDFVSDLILSLAGPTDVAVSSQAAAKASIRWQRHSMRPSQIWMECSTNPPTPRPSHQYERSVSSLHSSMLSFAAFSLAYSWILDRRSSAPYHAVDVSTELEAFSAVTFHSMHMRLLQPGPCSVNDCSGSDYILQHALGEQLRCLSLLPASQRCFSLLVDFLGVVPGNHNPSLAFGLGFLCPSCSLPHLPHDACSEVFLYS